MKNLVDNTAVLTGASGGIGVYIARALAKEHLKIVCISRSNDDLMRLCSEIDELGGNGIGIPFDISKLDELPLLVDKIHKLVGPVDILINNAAIEKFRSFPNYTLDDIQSILTLNLHAPMELSRLLIPDMIDRDCGYIVNIASGSGKKGAPYNSIYSASKAGLIMWSDAIRQEFADTNIEISIVCPSYTSAGMFLALDVQAPDGIRVSHPTEVAEAVLNSIKLNHTEINLGGFTAKLFNAVTQLSPQLGDRIFRQLSIVKLNQQCAHKQIHSGKKYVHFE